MVFVVSGVLGGGEGEDDKSDDYDDQVFKVDSLGSQLVLKLDNLGIPSFYKFSTPPRIIGSCNGLICLCIINGREHMDFSLWNPEFSLWNPATRQFRILPKSITIENGGGGGGCYSFLVAFGFDVETKDYKVVLVTGFKARLYYGADPMECLCRVQVYSLSTDSWRLLEGIDSLPGFPFSQTFEGLYLNGSCFFMARFFPSQQQMLSEQFPSEQQIFPPKKNDRFIISFDLTKEIITTIPLPDHDENQKLYLSYLGEKMALFTWYVNSDDYEDYEDYDIWVLNEHGNGVNKESWTKLHSFQIRSRGGEWNIPKGISNNGEFALRETKGGIGGLSKKMKLYNLVTKEVKKDFLCCSAVISRAADVYKQSLVSIIGGNGAAAAADRVIGGAM